MNKYTTLLIDAWACLILENEHGFYLNQELMEYLKSRSETKILVTNAKDEILKEMKSLLDGSNIEVFSLEFDPEKTDPKYFEILLKKYDLSTANCLYLDHSLENLNSAKKVGIKGFLYTDGDFDSFKAELSKEI